jgi:hypothetical protein
LRQVNIVSAVGTFIPPLVLFPFEDDFLKTWFPNWEGLVIGETGSGWMNNDVFPKVVSHIRKYVHSQHTHTQTYVQQDA